MPGKCHQGMRVATLAQECRLAFAPAFLCLGNKPLPTCDNYNHRHPHPEQLMRLEELPAFLCRAKRLYAGNR